MQQDRRQHPSGRPIRRVERKMLGFTRRPYDEPLTPGLRTPATANAIGFLHDAYGEARPDVFDLMNEGLTATEIVSRLRLRD